MPSPVGLSEGSQYDLTSVSESVPPNKSVVHVKLTDGALAAIEAYCKQKGNKNQPTIRFQGNQGTIGIPLPPGSETISRQFGFALSALGINANGSNQCLRQSRNASTALEDMGVMSHKVTIQGSNESYQSALVKMSQVEEENKRAGAKAIEESGPKIGGKVRKIIVGTKNQNNKLAVRNTIVPTPAPPKATLVKQLPPPPRPPPATIIPPPNDSLRTGARKRQRSTSPSDMPQQAKHHQPISKQIPPVSVPIINTHNMSLRDRVIHHLAVRAYKTAELLLRLKRDGLDDKDKELVPEILAEVATCNAKDKKHILMRQHYSESMMNCVLYSADDRALLARKLVMNCAGSSTSPAISPCHSAGKVSPATVTGAESTLGYSTSHISKRRVAHVAHSIPSESGLGSTATRHAAFPPSRTALLPDSNVINMTLDKRASLGLDSSSNSDTLNDDYLRLYVKITSKDQRQKYRRDFDTEYVEYKDMYSRVANHMSRFNELSQKVHQYQKGTAPYENLCKEIIEEYKQLKANRDYCKEHTRCQYLHRKLDHVKKLVADYDDSVSHAS